MKLLKGKRLEPVCLVQVDSESTSCDWCSEVSKVICRNFGHDSQGKLRQVVTLDST